MANITRIKAGDTKPEKTTPKTPTKEITKKVVKKAKTTKPEKTPNKFVRFLTAPARYIKNSWLEIRQVRWPNRKATWKLVGAIFIYSAFFIVLVMLLDALFNFIFSKIIG